MDILKFIKRKMKHNYIKDIILGVAVGDALGVPVEFKSRESLQVYPINEMIGFGTHHQPAGTWSDDTSLTLALADALTQDFDLQRIADNFVAWNYKNEFTPHGRVFDIGITTSNAIRNLANGMSPRESGANGEGENGNGSLMRILPLLAYIKDMPIQERYEHTRLVSAITHGHIRSVMACFYYLEFARQLLEKKDKFQIYNDLQNVLTAFFEENNFPKNEISIFKRLLQEKIYEYPDNMIHSSGYVLHTLEASIWCLLTNTTFETTVLEAVNLGSDTDTTGAVVSGLAGLLYGHQSIPKNWLNVLVKKEYLEEVADKLFLKV